MREYLCLSQYKIAFMHVISRKTLRIFWEAHPDAEQPLTRWYGVAKRATWANFGELRRAFGSADLVGPYVVFNISGNHYRLVSEIYFNDQVLLVRGVYTHREYDELDLKG